jgi:hypothetical protein
MLEQNLAFAEPNPVASVGPRQRSLDILVPQHRINETARCLLEAMGVSIHTVRWRDVKGPPVCRLLANAEPRLDWMNPEQAEGLVNALKRDEDEPRMPPWMHWMLYAWRRGTLTDLDGSIDFGEPGLDASRVVRDLLHYPA